MPKCVWMTGEVASLPPSHYGETQTRFPQNLLERLSFPKPQKTQSLGHSDAVQGDFHYSAIFLKNYKKCLLLFVFMRQLETEQGPQLDGIHCLSCPLAAEPH